MNRCAFLFALIIVWCNQPNSQSAERANKVKCQFPVVSIGNIFSTTPNQRSFFGKQKFVGPAQNTVIFSSGKSYVFQPNGKFFERPELIKFVSQNVIAHLRSRFNIMDERDDQNCKNVLTHLSSLKNLQSINFDKSDIDDRLLSIFSNQKQLKGISACNSLFKGMSLKDFTGCKRIAYLRFGGVSIQNSTLSNLRNFPDLRNVVLYRSGLNSEGMEELSKCQKLEILDVSKNPLITDKNVTQLSRIKSLKTLNLVATNISSSGLLKLSKSLPKTVITAPDIRANYDAKTQRLLKSTTNIVFESDSSVKEVNDDIKTLFAPTLRQ